MTGPSPTDRLSGRYQRIARQLEELFAATPDRTARMATAAALLHHKMPHFFWTGFYRLVGEDLVVGPYQGSLACQVLERGRGVCWECVRRGEPVLVPDVHRFPGHIACDARSKSEVVVPLREAGRVVAVLDVDSDRLDAFCGTDVEGLVTIADLIMRA
ncbi:MAG: GAF domain-containing protein [Acidobacteria bacterium]|nr:MAG: GAF domain-containing protein [Acidobacteriota bacterium]